MQFFAWLPKEDRFIPVKPLSHFTYLVQIQLLALRKACFLLESLFQLGRMPQVGQGSSTLLLLPRGLTRGVCGIEETASFPLAWPSALWSTPAQSKDQGRYRGDRYKLRKLDTGRHCSLMKKDGTNSCLSIETFLPDCNLSCLEKYKEWMHVA